MLGTVPVELRIRRTGPADATALLALERVAPERGALGVRWDLAVPHFELAARYPGVAGHVAEWEGAVAGTLFSSVAPTQWAGAVVPAAYLFSLRVHPTWQRRGVATALISHAWSEARAAGALLAWAHVGAGNDASLRTFASAGFARLRDGRLRIVLGTPRWPRRPLSPRGSRPALLAHVHGLKSRPDAGPWAIRPATDADLPALAALLNGAHAAHDLWRPCSAKDLAAQFAVPHHGLSDVLVAADRGGGISAVGAVLHARRLGSLRLLAPRRGPAIAVAAPVDALLARVPLAPRVLRHRALGGPDSDAGALLLRRLASEHDHTFSPLLVPLDPIDPSWPVVAALPGASVPMHVVLKGDGLLGTTRMPRGGARPMYLG